MQRTPHRLLRFATTAGIAGALAITSLVGLAGPATAHERTEEPLTRHSQSTTLVLVERGSGDYGFTAQTTKDTGDQQFCDGTPVDDDIVECDIDEIAWTCVNGDTDPTDGGCIGNADKPSVFPQD